MSAESGQAAGRNKLVYYDTNVWIAHLRGYNDEFFQSECDTLFDDMHEGKVKVVVSNHVLSETLHTIRKQVVETAPEGAAMDECNKLVDEKTKEFTGEVEKLKMQQKILIVPTSTADASLKDHYRYVWDKMHSMPFKSLTKTVCPACAKYLHKSHKGECPACKKDVKPKMAYRYSGMGYPDLDHAYMALQHNASVLYTHDKAFKNLWGDPEFEGMKICVFDDKIGWLVS
ncbi:hypothetical protein CENSYa_2010 [Cenarchaeum symbiosum A]|uniref:Uncharacterized protein n=1 Tax=Cenarchaeum symbiosum (strain A) TaxID=414004 RepID=A0RZ47_CENSY|nr:hypothetical protein CENSYa_2010 [Cenarchaeum symbiosum A]